MENRISELISASLEKIREVVDVNTVVGDPMTVSGGVTIIPVSKVVVGTASGGLDYFSKNLPSTEKTDPHSFGGGGGVGMNVVPLGFLTVRESGRVEFISVSTAGPSSTAVSIVDTVTDFLDRSPELIERFRVIIRNISDAVDKKKDAKKNESSPVPTDGTPFPEF